MTSYSSSPSPRIINKNVKQAWSNLKFYTRKTKKIEEFLFISLVSQCWINVIMGFSHWFNLQVRITVIRLFVEAVKVWNAGTCTVYFVLFICGCFGGLWGIFHSYCPVNKNTHKKSFVKPDLLLKMNTILFLTWRRYRVVPLSCTYAQRVQTFMWFWWHCCGICKTCLLTTIFFLFLS